MPALATLSEGWELTRTAPRGPTEPPGLDGAAWIPAEVPGTVAGALGAGDDLDVDAEDWWYRLRFGAEPAGPGEQLRLVLHGVATRCDVFLNGAAVAHGESMYAPVCADVTALVSAENELLVCCRALGPALAQRRRPRARWRTRLVADGNLRFHRTMLLGRAPGFAPGPAVAGIWRPVTLERRRGVIADEPPRLRAGLDGDAGVLDCTVALRALGDAVLPAALAVRVTRGSNTHEASLPVRAAADGTGRARGRVIVPDVVRWWPHTHGEPALYDVVIGDPAAPVHTARVGFRTLSAAADLRADGPALRVNGVDVFARGALWTPQDLRAPHAGAERLAPLLRHVTGAGMNMLRIPGIATYESTAFHDLCDELGILVWQDFMFANLDYPETDPEFMQLVADEARTVLDALGGRPSLAVLCGGSEVAQQVAMLGLDPGLAEGPLFGELLPAAVAGAEVDAPYLPSAPWGGDVPFRTDAGIANYYGVGAYLRPLADARAAGVRFASESLAFANVPDEDALAGLRSSAEVPAVHHPAWKAGVPRDVGAGWDFEDVRDHYLRRLFDTDPVALRSIDPERYLELSRAVTGEVMAEVFGEWRRGGSPCRGGLVLWLADHRPGAGWGVVDHRGAPKPALHHLARALAPVAVWSTDEGLGGVDVHAVNDTGAAIGVRLRVALYRGFETRVEEATEELELAAHSAVTRGVEAMIGHFSDVSWAYRFGPPAQDLIAVSLHDAAGGLLCQSFRFPAGRPLHRRSADALGLTATRHGAELRVASRAFAYGVRVSAPGLAPGDDWFSVEPGGERVLRLAGPVADGDPGQVTLTAVNLAGTVRVGRGDAAAAQ